MNHLNGKPLTIGIIGLGYVGLPLAIEFGKKFNTIGFDINNKRIEELREFTDRTLETNSEEMKQATHLQLSDTIEDLQEVNVFIVTVPTPIDEHKRPDLRPLISASKSVGKVLKKDDVVIYESTVYPGATEEDCVPVLETISGLTYNQDFFAGYSPERINPGDKEHSLTNITKVTSGSTPEVAGFVDNLYRAIINAGTHLASSMRVAEAAKVIENTQRDVNIALINELAMLFNKLGLDTEEVLQAAGSKWNFLPFKPGLVGGHCIGVDPYYLTHKAQQIGFHPQMILAGRRTNDGMGAFVAGELVKLMAKKGVYQPGARVLILGLTFKENCPDLRNTRVIDLINTLKDYNLDVDVHDPWADPDEAQDEYGVELVDDPEEHTYAAIIIAVAHDHYLALGSTGIRPWAIRDAVLYDLKHIFPEDEVDARL